MSTSQGHPSGMAEAADVRRRYLVLRATRWLPTGLIIPVFVLVMLDRGLSLGQIGLVVAGQGIAVMALELPTGGLADAIGRRRVLVVASAIELVAGLLFLVADTLPLLLAFWVLEGIYRALESGPLDAWFVDRSQAADPDADLERGLSTAGVVLGLAIAVGAVGSSVLVATAPFPGLDPLLGPVVVAVALRVIDLVAIHRLMDEPERHGVPLDLGEAVRDVPRVIRTAGAAARASRSLRALFAVEALWTFGMIAFETFTPARLEQVLGDADAAAVYLGPSNAAGWAAAAGGAALVPLVTRRLRPRHAGPLLLAALGGGVVVIGTGGTAALVVVGYVVTMTMHGAANPVHQGLLHRAITGSANRATLISVNSLTSSFGGLVGGIALGALADATTLTTATLTGAAVIAAAGPLYLLTRTPPDPADDAPPSTPPLSSHQHS